MLTVVAGKLILSGSEEVDHRLNTSDVVHVDWDRTNSARSCGVINVLLRCPPRVEAAKVCRLCSSIVPPNCIEEINNNLL